MREANEIWTDIRKLVSELAEIKLGDKSQELRDEAIDFVIMAAEDEARNMGME